MRNEKEMKFEEAFDKLKQQAEIIKSGELSLEESIKAYEEGMKYYQVCSKILTEAKQKIETFE
ncbi:MAG: exodeoxyribonuclease VII small subunit [Anaerovoracaceae bacterium]|jgi:exodeoxyribonuclease VII small subunit